MDPGKPGSMFYWGASMPDTRRFFSGFSQEQLIRFLHMTTINAPARPNFFTSKVMNKVPEVTIFFWIIKILCTTVGESVADFVNVNLNWGLSSTSVATGLILAVVLIAQISLRRYVAGIYWLTVVLVSVFGTLVTDNMTDNLGVPLQTSTIVFSILLGIVFLSWYLSEKTLSIHSIFTRKRECFYWLTIFVTFALGTAVGDLISEGLGVGYLWTGILCASLIALVTLGWRLGLNPILAFWIAYILTRPLGASLGDLLAKPSADGGLGLGVTITSVIFLTAILITIVYLTIRKPDVLDLDPNTPENLEIQAEDVPSSGKSALIQTAIVVLVFVVGGGAFYAYRTSVLNNEAATVAASNVGSASPLGDLTPFITITQDSLDLLNSGDQAGATVRIGDLESEWDKSAAVLKRQDGTEWTAVDDKIDTVLRELRSTTPNPTTEVSALEALLTQMAGPATASTGSASPLGDVTSFIIITQDSLDLLNSGDQAGATARIGDLESEWDKSAAVLKRINGSEWTAVDDKIDTVLRELRSTTPNPTTEVSALEALLAQLTNPA